jgi:lipopolysaccharide assembly outer membrane protein LptD (OstA)
MEDAVGDKKKEPLIITCSGPLEIEYDKNIATFHNNVHVIESPTSEIFCDRMVAEFDFKNKKINKVTAFDNVRIVKDGNTSYSDQAVYTNDDKKIVLTGSPKLIIYSEGDLSATFGN